MFDKLKFWNEAKILNVLFRIKNGKLPVGKHKLILFSTLIFRRVKIDVVDGFCFFVVSFVISILIFFSIFGDKFFMFDKHVKFKTRSQVRHKTRQALVITDWSYFSIIIFTYSQARQILRLLKLSRNRVSFHFRFLGFPSFFIRFFWSDLNFFLSSSVLSPRW